MMLNPAESLDHRFLARARRFTHAAAVFVMLSGASVLAGWLFDIHRLKTTYAGITVKANTAFCLLFAGTSLLLITISTDSKLVRICVHTLAVVVALVGLFTLSEHIIRWDLRIDQLIFTVAHGALDRTSPGRMGPPASTCFMLAGM